MNKVTCSLNFMYSMERFATAVYKVQKGAFHNETVLGKMAYAVDNEHQHAVNLKGRIVDLKSTPFPLALLFQWVGWVVGSVTRCFGNVFALKAGVAIEKRAVKDYSYFLNTLALDDKTKLLIKEIIADEELHIRNWQDSIKILKGGE